MGVGTTPLGNGPYGFGSPATPPAQAGQIYADAKRGAVNTGRRIDPLTRQYVLDSFGRIDGHGTVPQLVQIAYSTKRGSSAIPTLGERIGTVENIDDSFTRQITAYATEPVQSLIDQKLLRISSIDVTRPGIDAAIITVSWVDLSTGIEHQSTL